MGGPWGEMSHSYTLRIYCKTDHPASIFFVVKYCPRENLFIINQNLIVIKQQRKQKTKTKIQETKTARRKTVQ